MADGSGLAPTTGPATDEAPVLEANGLTVRFRRRDAEVAAVSDVSFALHRRETLTILGESGSGKSVTLKALDGSAAGARRDHRVGETRRTVDPRPFGRRARPAARTADLDGVPGADHRAGPGLYDRRPDRGNHRPARRHRRRTARTRARELLERVRIPAAERRLGNYPHEMSGGMRQRAMIALALACSPDVLLADEPTTALDVTVQIQILLLLRQLQQELGMAIVFVTHDVGVAAEISDRVAVMYAGRFVETGTRARDHSRAATPLHGRASWLRRPRRTPRRHARRDPRRPARSRRFAARLRLRPALSTCRRPLPSQRSAGDYASRRPHGSVRP